MSDTWVIFPGDPLYEVARADPDSTLNPDGTVSVPLGGQA